MTGFVQQFLSVSRHLILFCAVLIAWMFLRERPDFSGWPDAMVEARVAEVRQASPQGWTLHGAWELSADDPRVAGLSGIVCHGAGAIEAVTDLGNLIAFRAPREGELRVTMAISGRRSFREGEALLVRGDTRIVAQENWDELLFLHGDGTTTRQKLSVATIIHNRGIEALLDLGGAEQAVLAFHEGGDLAFRVAGGAVHPMPVVGSAKAITDAARHPDGRAFVLQRALGPTGFSAAIAQAMVGSQEVSLGPPVTLPLPANANAEGICIEPRGADGSTRLWVVSDDNGLPMLAQRLVAWDVPDNAWPSAPEGAED